jgi:hypothetical protein
MANNPDYTRQRERTIDNLKRLFALVFSLSFAAAGVNFFGRIKPYLVGEQKFYDLTFAAIAMNIEIFLVFAVTAGVFYHHGCKFLDRRYALAESPHAEPLGFAMDFLTLVAQVIPFVFMANALSSDIYSVYGFTWFFFSYCAAFFGGLLLLYTGELRSHSDKGSLVGRTSNHGRMVRHYWILMNSAILLAIGILFMIWVKLGAACPLNPALSGYSFLIIFGILALLRDVLDFFWIWPFQYPQKEEPYQGPLHWPLNHMEKHIEHNASRYKYWLITGTGICASAFAMAFYNDWFDVLHWSRACQN